jgi:hypothetical protein
MFTRQSQDFNSLSLKLNIRCLVLVRSRNGFASVFKRESFYTFDWKILYKIKVLITFIAARIYHLSVHYMLFICVIFNKLCSYDFQVLGYFLSLILAMKKTTVRERIINSLKLYYEYNINVLYLVFQNSLAGKCVWGR